MSKPNLTQLYVSSGMDLNVSIIEKIKSAWNNPIYGGKILEDIGDDKNKKNSLLTEIFKYKSVKSI